MTRIITVLQPDEAEALRARVAALEFVDGVATARGLAADAKQNTQALPSSTDTAALVSEVQDLLDTNAAVQSTAFPKRFGRVGFNRYWAGDRYGLHVDSPLMGRGTNRVRTDVSFTLFLSNPDDYEGGALRIADGATSSSFRLPAGQAVLYPTRLLHEVTPVTAGERISAIGWIESWIPDPELRDLAAKAATLQQLTTADVVTPLTRLLANEVAAAIVRIASRG